MWAVARLAPTVSFQERVTLTVVHPVLLNVLGTYEIGAFTFDSSRTTCPHSTLHDKYVPQDKSDDGKLCDAA